MAFWHRYKDYYSQGMTLMNDGWLADPIATFSAMAVVQGNPIAQAVIQGIQTGQGVDLLKYYQYSTRRYKERNYSWTFERISDDTLASTMMTVTDLVNLIPSLDINSTKIIYENSDYSEDGAKYFWDMQSTYGLDSFNTDYNGEDVYITGLSEASSVVNGLDNPTLSYHVGMDRENGTKPYILLNPTEDTNKLTAKYNTGYEVLDTVEYTPEPSKGVIYWTSSTGEVDTGLPDTTTKDTYTTSDDSDSFLIFLTQNGTDVGSTVTIRADDWTEPRYDYATGYTSNDVIDTKVAKMIEVTTEEDINVEVVQYTVYEIKEYKEGRGAFTPTEITYSKRIYYRTITYDEEHILWATETDENFIGIREFYEQTAEALNQEDLYSSNKGDKLFKLYPYLPMKERDTWFLDTDDEDFQTIVEAYETINEASKDTEDSSSLESDTASSREASLLNRENNTSISSEVRQAQRVLARSGRYLRSVDANSNGIRTAQSESALNRDLYELGDYLRLDYGETLANMYSAEGMDDVYDCWLQPAVQLTTDKNDVMIYWEVFWKRLYSKLVDGGYSKFASDVTALKDLSTDGTINTADIPLYRLDFKSDPIENSTELNHKSGGFNGSISFAFIKKLTIKGSVRNIRRKRDIRDIRRGKPLTLSIGGVITDIDSLLKPLEELASDTYHTTDSGKDIHIGQAPEFHEQELEEASVNELTFQKWGYTFFCNPISDDEISVIAVAGLCARTTVAKHEAYHWGTAWYDLEMQYQRNYKKYVEHKSEEDRVVTHTITTGSKKHKKIQRIQYFCTVPLDYNTCRRLGGTRLTRFADRSLITMTWSHQHQKSLAGWVATVIQVVTLAISIAIAYFTSGTGAKAGTSFNAWATNVVANMTLSSVLTKIAINLVTSMAVKYGLKLIAKVFGLNGLLAIIIATMGLILARMNGIGVNLASMPYASQVANAVVSEGINQYNKVIQDKIEEIQENIRIEGEKLTEAMEDLEDAYEDYYSNSATYNTQQVLEALTQRILHPEEYFARTLESNPNIWCSEDFLSNFIEQKLTLDVDYFNLKKSTDFSLNLDNDGNIF